MKGQVLDFSIDKNAGVITALDGSRYTFGGSDWQSNVPLTRGMTVDFDVQETTAVSIYKALEESEPPSLAIKNSKSKIAAGLLGIFLGGLGIHKFYLGYTGPGLVYLLINTIGWFVTIFLLGIPNYILAIMALIEGIIYLTKTDEEFEQIYVVNQRKWF